MRTKFCFAGLAAICIAAASADEAEKGDALVLATRGKVASCTIVLPAKASDSQEYAADELQEYVKRMTGVELPIKKGAESPTGNAIVIGGDADAQGLGEDGFRLLVKDGKVFVIGSPVRGCLYGVYELLEAYGGCRWYSSWHTVVPERATFEVPATLDTVQKPDFVMRTSWWWDVNQHNEFAAHLRINSRPWGKMENRYGGDVFRFCRTLQSCHTFNTLIPPSKYRKEHPEYFSRVEGDYTQPCLTNPEVLAIVTSNVIEHIRKDPSAKAYGVSQNDWANYCTCPKCKAVDEEEGSHAGTLVRFVNAIAEAVDQRFPGKIIETLAYQYTRHPPTKTKLRYNVVPCLCSIECDFGRPIPESTYHQNKSFMKDIEGWRPMTDQLYVWDYVTNFRNYPYPFPNCYSLQGNLKFFRDNKVKEMFPEGDYQGSLADFDVLKAWLLAKWQWNADLPMDKLLDDFFQGYYGKAAPYVRTYFEELHKLHRADPNKPRLIYEDVMNPTLSNEFLLRAAGLFKQAKSAVVKEPYVYGKNVRGTAFSVDYTRFMRAESRGLPLLWFSKRKPTRDDVVQGTMIARDMLLMMNEFAPVRLSESKERNDQQLAMIKTAAERNPSRSVALPEMVSRGCVEEKDMCFFRPASMGAIVDDPLAEDGKALKLFNNHYEWSTHLQMTKFAYDQGQRFKLRMRCRVERKPGAKGEAIWAGIWDENKKNGVVDRYVQAEEIDTDDYAWYDVGTFTPNDDQYFWIGPGRFDKEGKSRINALYVDKIELSLE